MWCKNLTHTKKKKNSGFRLSLPLPLYRLYSPFLPLSSLWLFLFLALIYLRWAAVTSWACLWRRHCVCTATTEGRAKQSSLPGFVLQTLTAIIFLFFYFTDVWGRCSSSERTSAARGLSFCSCCRAADAQKDRSTGCIISLLLFVIFTAALLSSQGYIGAVTGGHSLSIFLLLL